MNTRFFARAARLWVACLSDVVAIAKQHLRPPGRREGSTSGGQERMLLAELSRRVRGSSQPASSRYPG